MTYDVLTEELMDKLQVLNERVWEYNANRAVIDLWLDNFEPAGADASKDRIHALFLLSQFVYFGLQEVRELLRSLFRDHYRYPIIAEYRRANGDERNVSRLHDHFSQELKKTRFLGIGNPAESGTHLLYYFRQVNRLEKSYFVTETELIDRRFDDPEAKLSSGDIERLVFIDDFCGSGTQATAYSKKMLEVLREVASRSGKELHVSYLVLVANKSGIEAVRANTSFDVVDAVFELDDSYRCLEAGARQFSDPPNGIEQGHARGLAQRFGERLWKQHPRGYKDGQLLLGFHHNVPDNSLPILWWGESSTWYPMFLRFHKA
jgi:hypothetical protein